MVQKYTNKNLKIQPEAFCIWKDAFDIIRPTLLLKEQGIITKINFKKIRDMKHYKIDEIKSQGIISR